MSRKFTDSEIRAYSKNRFEERILKYRLDKLKEEFGINHDSTVKIRSDLMAECKDIRLTTGGSPRPNDLTISEDIFDISKRVKRPWAYSVMETTYNALYQEAEIPLPRSSSKAFRSKSAAAEPRRRWSSQQFAASKSISSMVALSKEHDDTDARVTASASVMQQIMDNRSVSNPEIRLNNRPLSSGNTEIETLHGNTKLSVPSCLNAQSNNKVKQIKCQAMGTNSKHEIYDGDDISKEVDERNQNQSLEIKEEENMQFGLVVDRKPNTQLISLPPVYKIDSKAYQQAERERTITRSQSRVSFSGKTLTKPTHEEFIPNAANTLKSFQNEQESKDTDATKNMNAKDNYKRIEQLQSDNTSSTTHVETTSEGTSFNQSQTPILYKGKILRNYVRPEERYKFDPIVMKKRQNRMDKLAKESVTFLKRVNHENIRVEIAFPRSARARLMTKLVRENSIGKGRKHSNTDGEVIKTKIEKFMVSISDYVNHQQNESAEIRS